MLLITIKDEIGYAGLYFLNFGILVCTLIAICLFKPEVDWTKENEKWNDGKERRHQKKLAKHKKTANIYLRDKVKQLEQQNYDLNFEIKEIKAFLRYNVI